jgi:hypothetical protein
MKKLVLRSSSESILSSRISHRQRDHSIISGDNFSQRDTPASLKLTPSQGRSFNHPSETSSINNDLYIKLTGREARNLSTPVTSVRNQRLEKSQRSTILRPHVPPLTKNISSASSKSKQILYDMYLNGPSQQREELKSSQLTDCRLEAVKSIIESNFSKKISLPELYWKDSDLSNERTGSLKGNSKKKEEDNLAKVLCMIEENHKILRNKKSFSGDRVLLACDIPVRLTPKQAKIDENYNIQSLVKSMSSKGEKVENAIEYNISLQDFQKYLEKSRDMIKKGIDPSKKGPDTKQVRSVSSKQKIIQLVHQTTKRANKFEESQLSIISD